MPVRPAMVSDVPGVLPMVRAVCDMHARMDPERYPMLPDVVERYERWLPVRATDPRSVFLVAEDDDAPGSLIGFIVGTVEPNIPIYALAEFGFLHDLWVEPAHRRRGYARRLVSAAIERFAAIGVSQVRLETAAANDTARRLFQSCGFRAATIDMLTTITRPS